MMYKYHKMHYHEQLFKLLPVVVLNIIGTPASEMYQYMRKGKLCFVPIILDSLFSSFQLVGLIFERDFLQWDSLDLYYLRSFRYVLLSEQVQNQNLNFVVARSSRRKNIFNVTVKS